MPLIGATFDLARRRPRCSYVADGQGRRQGPAPGGARSAQSDRTDVDVGRRCSPGRPLSNIDVDVRVGSTPARTPGRGQAGRREEPGDATQ